MESIYPAIPDTQLLMGLIQAAQKCEVRYFVGIARSHDSFYIDREEEITECWSKRGVLGSDMETAALFTIGSLRGVKTASVLNTVVEFKGDLTKEINGYVDGNTRMIQGESNEILVALEAFVNEENK